MSFALPIALTLSALALPIIALYILKVRLRRVPVSTNLFWKQIYEEKPPRSIWQHFRHLLSLLLQLLLLLLIVFAIADPYFSWQLLQARRIVIVVDNSASMRSFDILPTRLDAAKKAAQEVINGLRFRDEVAIVLAGNTPEVVVGMTGHAPTLREAIDGIPFSDNPTSLTTSIDLGRRLIGDHPHGQVLVMTDGCVDMINTAETKTMPSTGKAAVAKTESMPSVEYRLFASEAANVGIIQLQVRRSLIDPLGYEILAAVKNASASPVTCRLELTLNDIPVDVIPLKLKPEELWSRSIEKTSLEGGLLKAALTEIAPGSDESVAGAGSKQTATTTNQPEVDQLPTDNSAYALLPDRKTQRVLIVSAGNWFLQKVFESNALVEVSVQKEFPQVWPVDGIIVLHGNIPETLPPGNVFVIDPIGNCDQWDQGEILENPIVTDQDKASPLMTHIRLDNVLVPDARQLQFKTPPHSLAKTLSGEIVYADVKRPNGKCLALSVNLDSSDLAFRTAFPIMIANSLGWFSGTTGELQASVPTGSVTTLTVQKESIDASRTFLLSPSQKVLDITIPAPSESDSGDIPATIGPLNEVGLWKLTQSKVDSAQLKGDVKDSIAEVAVNLASTRETDLRPLKELRDSSQTKTLTAGWFSRPFWFYLVIAACILTSVEWFLYHRRFIS